MRQHSNESYNKRRIKMTRGRKRSKRTEENGIRASRRYKLVMCDMSKKYRFRNNFVDIVIVLIFDTALAYFNIYRKVTFCDNYRNIEEYFDKSTAFSV